MSGWGSVKSQRCSPGWASHRRLQTLLQLSLNSMSSHRGEALWVTKHSHRHTVFISRMSLDMLVSLDPVCLASTVCPSSRPSSSSEPSAQVDGLLRVLARPLCCPLTALAAAVSVHVHAPSTAKLTLLTELPRACVTKGHEGCSANNAAGNTACLQAEGGQVTSEVRVLHAE